MTKVCSKCLSVKPLVDFYAAKNGSTDGKMRHCKKCQNAMTARWVSENRERKRQLDTEWRAENHAKTVGYQRAHYQRNKERKRKAALEYHYKYKDAVFAAYGGYICACCGETERQFLCIDHVRNDGADHRRKIGRRVIYQWIALNGFPPGFQVLCANCNLGKQLNGGLCPHKSELGANKRRRAA